MSLARVYSTKGPVRKDGLKCGRCGQPIVKGKDRRRTFSVGFRGYEQTRCMRPECTPTRAELESSALASVYSVIDVIDFGSLGSLEDLNNARDEVADACDEVADEYESNEMYDINPDLQERTDMIRSAGEELRNWEPEEEQPDEDQECLECDGTGEVQCEECEGDNDECEECGGSGTDACAGCDGSGRVEADASDLEEWLGTQRESLEAAIDEMELP